MPNHEVLLLGVVPAQNGGRSKEEARPETLGRVPVTVVCTLSLWKGQTVHIGIGSDATVDCKSVGGTHA